MATHLTSEQTGNIFFAFVEWMRFLHSNTLKDIQTRLDQFVGVNFTNHELEVFKEEFEYALSAIGFVLLNSKLSKISEMADDVLVSRYLLIMYAAPICGAPFRGLDSQHSKDFHKGFIRYLSMNLEGSIKEICEKVKEAGNNSDQRSGSEQEKNEIDRPLRITGIKSLLTSVTFPLIFNSMNEFLDKQPNGYIKENIKKVAESEEYGGKVYSIYRAENGFMVYYRDLPQADFVTNDNADSVGDEVTPPLADIPLSDVCYDTTKEAKKKILDELGIIKLGFTDLISKSSS